MKKLTILIAALLTLTIFTACGGSNLTGRWTSVDGDYYIEFFSDGTYITDDANYSGDYSAENGRMKLSGILVPDLVFSYTKSGNTLKLTDESGETREFRKN